MLSFNRTLGSAAEAGRWKLCMTLMEAWQLLDRKLHKNNHISGQIIATSHDLTSNGGLIKEIPLFQGNLRW